MPPPMPLPPGTPQWEKEYCSAGGVTVAYADEWIKHHVIESDGLCPLIYQYLHKNTKGREHTLSSIRLPETVVFDLNFPRAWYTYDTENLGIAKRPSKMLDADTMYQYFSTSSKGCDIVAQFFYSSVSVDAEWKDLHGKKDSHPGQIMTYVEFFTAETLHTFLFQQRRKPDGVLQKFVVPKGEGNSRRNFQLQVMWSPLMTTVYRRTNKHRIDDRMVSMPTRAATYDGPAYYSDESLVADETKSRATQLCEDIAEHFFSTERKQMTRLNLFFKIDDDNRLWLTWCSGIRVAADSLNPSTLRVPPVFDMRTEVVNEGANTVAMLNSRRQRQKQLLTLDHEMFRVTHDLGFALTINASHGRQATALNMPGMGDAELDERSLDPRYNPNHPMHESFRRVCDPPDDFDADEKRRSTAMHTNQSDSSAHDGFDSNLTPQQSVCEELTALAMDAWYAIYSTTISEQPRAMPTSRVSLSEPLTAALKEEELSRLLELLGLLPANRKQQNQPPPPPPEEGTIDASAAASASAAAASAATAEGVEAASQPPPLAPTTNSNSDGNPYYVVAAYLVTSGRRLDRPSTQVESDVVQFFQDLFAKRGDALVKFCLEKFGKYFDL